MTSVSILALALSLGTSFIAPAQAQNQGAPASPGLSTLSDPEASARVREIATSDAYTFVNPRGQTIFPVRQQAEVLLRHDTHAPNQ
jgi:hypothetical protein